MKGGKTMKLKQLPWELTICRVPSLYEINLDTPFFFIGRTDEEISLVCRTEDLPERTAAREDGWRAFRIEGTLDFSLTGILAKLSGVLAERKIGIFALSTYNTDYVLVKKENVENARAALEAAGYEIT